MTIRQPRMAGRRHSLAQSRKLPRLADTNIDHRVRRSCLSIILTQAASKLRARRRALDTRLSIVCYTLSCDFNLLNGFRRGRECEYRLPVCVCLG